MVVSIFKGNWLNAALWSLLFSALYSLFVKFVSTELPGSVSLFYIFATQSLCLLAILHSQKKLSINLSPLLLCILVGCLCFLGNISEFEAVKLAPNVGYANSLKMGQLVLVTLGSVLLFRDQKLSLGGMTGVLLIVGGIISFSLEQGEETASSSNSWLWWGVLSTIVFSAMLLIVKKITYSVASDTTLFYPLAASSVLFLINGQIASENFLVGWGNFSVLCLAGVIGIIANRLIFYSVSKAPNAGYVMGINGAQVVVITVASLFLFPDQSISVQGVAALTSILLGVFLLSKV